MDDQMNEFSDRQDNVQRRPVIKASLGFVYGAGLGQIIGAALGNPALGLIFGAGLGLLFGPVFDRE